MICMKRSIAVVALALAMIVCAVVVTDESDAQARDNGFVWTPDIDTATLHEYTGNDTVVEIPSEITIGGTTYTVTSIAGSAFVGTDVEEVIIPDTVTSIGNDAFRGCTELRYVTINGSVQIGSNAFNSCSSLMLVDFVSDPETIGTDAFNLGSQTYCSYRAPNMVDTEAHPEFATMDYIEPGKNIVRFVTVDSPESVGDLGFAIYDTGATVELPQEATVHGYEIEVFDYAVDETTPIDLTTFTIGDSDVVLTLVYTYKLFSVDFIVDGETYLHQDLYYNTVIELPENPTKETDARCIYTFSNWEGYTEGMTVSDNVTFTAVFKETIREYTIQFLSNGQIVQSTVMKYGDTIVPPIEDPVKETSDDGIDYRFTGWGGYTSGMTVTGDVIFDALFIESNHEYTIKFVVDGVTVKEDKLLFEEAIVPPEDPVKENANGIKFTFAGWEGYTEGMTVTDDMTFTATFTESPVEEGSSNTWIIVVVVVIVVVFVGLFLFRKFH